jgi:hypothetical protein
MIRVQSLPPIYPPRPWGAIPPESVSRYRGYIAQYKFNDIRLLISIGPDGVVSLQTRKRQPLKSFGIDERLCRQFARLRTKRGKLYLLDGGVLRSGFGPEQRKAVVLWDLLVYESQYLLGTTYEERYRLLSNLCVNPRKIEAATGHETALEVGPDLWLARNFTSDFTRRFEMTRKMDEIEGLVLKDPRGKLEWGAREENNGDWQIRVRKPSARHLM